MVTKFIKTILCYLALIFTFFTLTSCNAALERMSRIGQPPKFTNLDIPPTEADEEEIERREHIQRKLHSHMQKTNSLWQPGTKSFFRDSRAWQVGDIIRVVVQVQDSASLNNSTQHKKDGSSSLGIPKLFGKEKGVATFLSGSGDATALLSTNSKRAHNGSGNISRKETVNTEIAAIVTKILPNGNLFIQGQQEIRVNHELRAVKVAGIIRPKDISSSNSINTNQMAEARIAYGGVGTISDMQQPPYGSQIIDAISPF